jgi:hypothetical protein
MGNEILLNCSILGHNVRNVFLVDILHSRTVGHLKGAIKKEKEPTLNHIAADQLEIWKVSDPTRSVPAITDA